MKKLLHGAIFGLTLCASAALEAATPTEIVMRQIRADGDVEKMMADYADDAIIMQEGAAIQGKAAIRSFFSRSTRGLRKAPSPNGTLALVPGEAGATLSGIEEKEDVVIVRWQKGMRRFTEKLVVRRGKIIFGVLYMNVPTPAQPTQQQGLGRPGT